MREEISNGENFIDENTKWVYTEEKGVQAFALYGIGDGTKATPPRKSTAYSGDESV